MVRVERDLPGCWWGFENGVSAKGLSYEWLALDWMQLMAKRNWRICLPPCPRRLSVCLLGCRDVAVEQLHLGCHEAPLLVSLTELTSGKFRS